MLGPFQVLGVPEGQRKRAQPWGQFIPSVPHCTTFSPRTTDLSEVLAPLQKTSLSEDGGLHVPGSSEETFAYTPQKRF